MGLPKAENILPQRDLKEGKGEAEGGQILGPWSPITLAIVISYQNSSFHQRVCSKMPDPLGNRALL